MATIQRFEDIGAWQKARVLSREVHRLSNQTSFARDFGLRDQIRSASTSRIRLASACNTISRAAA